MAVLVAVVCWSTLDDGATAHAPHFSPLPAQSWVRALRAVMRDRMLSIQSLYQHQLPNADRSAGKAAPFSDDAELLDTYFILENYQVRCPLLTIVVMQMVCQPIYIYR